MARATSSLPVPDSPWISTGMSGGATFSMVWNSARIGAGVPDDLAERVGGGRVGAQRLDLGLGPRPAPLLARAAPAPARP